MFVFVKINVGSILLINAMSPKCKLTRMFALRRTCQAVRTGLLKFNIHVRLH